MKAMYNILICDDEQDIVNALKIYLDAPDVKLFEASKIFVPKEMPVTEQPLEIPQLCIGMYGEKEDFFTLKGLVEELLDMFAYKVDYAASSERYLHPGRQAVATTFGKKIATFGEVHPAVSERGAAARCKNRPACPSPLCSMYILRMDNYAF